ncbi:MAG TPA: hypothetical protein PLA48_13005 [Holophaga sp.]|nr:hypothetical protein [Holophaga sp.]
MLLGLQACLSLAAAAQAPFPMERVPVAYQAAVQAVVKHADFTFETTTKPSRVRLETMEKLFDHPSLAAAMWRHCRFVPSLYAFEQPGKNLTVDDGKGLHGTLYLVNQQPGMRIYYIEGRVEKGRMNNPFAVGAKMVVVYRYWKGGEGFQSHLNTWTSLDSAILSLVTRPFRKYIRFRQEEFIAYITMNISQGGEFAQLHPAEFGDPIKQEGDPVAVKQFVQVFGR